MRTSFARPQLGLSASVSFPLLSLLLLNGCGGGSSSSTSGGGGGTTPTAKTTVAIQVSSKANDQLSQYTMTIQSIALTNSSGSTTILNNAVNLDFTAANGNAYPVAVVQVPQGTYTSATINIAAPGFAHAYTSSTGPSNERYSTSNQPTTATVNLPSPITISGTTMGLNLSLDVSASISLSNPMGTNPNNATGTPNITLTVFGVSAESTAPANGKCIDLYGQLTAVSSSSMTATLGASGALQQQNAGLQPGQSITAALNSSTSYQGGISNSSLKTGQLANFDLVLEPDGSYTVSRIEVDDQSATSVTIGMASYVDPTVSAFHQFPVVFEGSTLTGSTGSISSTTAFVIPFNSSSAKFQVSPSISLSSLAFTFGGSTFVPGQNVAVAASSYPSSGSATATSITLMPQTIDAKIASGPLTNGNYAVWTVTLASYDPIVQVNTSPGTGLQLGSSANTVQVYVGSNTAKLSSQTLATGGTFRFHGLLFDNNGALVMVADQYNDGVNQ